MIVAIHQPNYFPWLGYFCKIALSDSFVFLDDAQFSRNSFINRSRIESSQELQWLTVPVLHRQGQAINQTRFAHPHWGRKHLQTLRSVYGRSPGFCLYFSPLAELLQGKEWPNLAAFNIAAVQTICEFLSISSPTLCSSKLGVDGTSDRRLGKIVRAVGGDTYLSGPGGAKYQSPKTFEASGVKLRYLDYPNFRYPQPSVGAGRRSAREFHEGLSILDFLFNCGKECEGRFASFLDQA